MRNLGNIASGQTLYFLFSTNDGCGAAIAPATVGTVSVYKDNNTAQTTAGVTYTANFDGITGVHAVAIGTSDSFYATAHDYAVVLTGAVIDGETVNVVLAEFSIENRHPTPSGNADALLDRANAVETSITPRQALRIMAAMLAGKVSGAGTGVETFLGLDGSTQRVIVTADRAGNRTGVSYSSGS